MSRESAEDPQKNPEEAEYETYIGRVVRGAGVGSFGQVIGRVLNYATQIMLARMYGPAQLGLYVLGTTLIQVSVIFAQLGMNYGVVRYVAHYRAEGETARVRGTIIMALRVSLILSLVLATLMFFSAGFLANTVFNEPLLESVFRILSISLPFFAVMSIALWATQGFQTMKYETYIQLIQRPLLNFVLIVAFYFLGAQILGAATAFVVSVIVGAISALYGLRRLFPEIFDRSIRPEFDPRRLFGVSLPMTVASSTQYLHPWITATLLGIFASASAVGIFTVAVRTAILLTLIFEAFAMIFSPVVSGLYSRGRLEDLGSLYQEISRWIFIGSIALFLVLVVLSADMMAVFGSEFVSGQIVLIVVAVANLFKASAGPATNVLAMTDNQNIVLSATLCSTFASAAVALALVPGFGILGAGLAMAAATVLESIITLCYVRRRLNVWPYTRGYLKPLAAGILAAVTILLCEPLLDLPSGFFSLLVLGPLLMLVFLGILLALGLPPSDRQLLATLWESFKKSRRQGTE